MQVVLGGLSISLNSLTTYSSATGLWTLGTTHPYYNLTINSGRPLAVKLVKGSPLYNLPTGTNTDGFYYLFKTGHTIGLAASYADAESLIPIVFASSGDLFTCNGQKTTDYRLKPLYLECCDDEINEDQDTVLPGPEKLRKMVSVNLSGFSIAPLLSDSYAPDSSTIFGANTILGMINGSWDLYLENGTTYPSGVPYGPAGTIFNMYYINFKINRATYGETSYDYQVTLKLFVTIALVGSDYIATYSLIVSQNFFSSSSYSLSINPAYMSTVNLGSLASVSDGTCFDSIPSMQLQPYPFTPPRFYVAFVVPETVSATFSGDYMAEILPETLTLKKSLVVGDVAKLERFGSLYPVRGWTTNNYSDDLPDSIVLEKVGYKNYESEPFTLAVNVVNRVRLRLTIYYRNILVGSPTYSIPPGQPYNYTSMLGAFSYVYSDKYSGGYLFSEPLKFTRPVAAAYGYGGDQFYNEPAVLSSGKVKIVFFRMSGTPYQNIAAPNVSECFATAVYNIDGVIPT
jgi:hypothetical protein